jgi:hypothetical protein
MLSDRVGFIMMSMGISEQSARSYVTDDVLREMARDMALDIADERPGADLRDVPANIPAPVESIARAIQALVEATRIRARDLDVIGTDGGLDAIFFLATALQRSALIGQVVRVPQVVLTRAARLLGGTATILGDNPGLHDGEPGEAEKLAGALAADAVRLRRLVTQHGTSPDPPDAS